MAGDQHSTRVGLAEAKILITKKIGAQRAEKYFNLLSRFFSKKLNKSEFDKLCIVAVGRENIRLHNWLIKSIIKNACLSKSAPTIPSKPNISANGYQISCFQSLYRDCIPRSPRKRRTRAIADRPSPLGPHSKPHVLTCGESAPKGILETHNWKNLTAPLGVQIRENPSPKVFSVVETCYSKRELPDTISLRRRLEQKLEAQGVEVSLDYANLLNAGLDVYLKRLIKPCLDLASSAHTNYTYGSSVDLRAAMEFDGPLLGQDWPLQLETISEFSSY